MKHLILLPTLQAAVGPTEIIEPHRQPTHPAVIPIHFGKSQGLSHLALSIRMVQKGLKIQSILGSRDYLRYTAIVSLIDAPPYPHQGVFHADLAY
jgi:hypothetical protein